MSKVSYQSRKQHVQAKDSIEANQSEEFGADLLSGYGHGRRRSRAERGLPSKKLLSELAKTYLTIQRQRWPSLRSSGILPRPTESNLTRMATDYRSRFLDKESPRSVTYTNSLTVVPFICGILPTNPTHVL
jgi:hypothetical protein